MNNAQLSKGCEGNKNGTPPFLVVKSLWADLRFQLPNNFFHNNGVETFAIPQTLANIKLPENFIEDLEKIENFYDLHLQDILPLDLLGQPNNGDYPHVAGESPAEANSGNIRANISRGVSKKK